MPLNAGGDAPQRTEAERPFPLNYVGLVCTLRNQLRMKPQSSQANNGSQQATADRDQVARLAHQLYVENGSVDGHDVEHWLAAEKLWAARQTRPQAKAAKGARPNHAETSSKQQSDVQPLDQRENPMARDERGSQSREEIRSQSHYRTAPRQSLRRPERSSQPR